MTPKLILVPDDFTELATHALRYAGKLAQRFGAHLLVIHADPLADVEVLRVRLEEHVAHNVEPGVPFDTQIAIDWPVAAIVEKACDTGADLIIMGTHGRSGLPRLFFGSVTEAVVRMATVPVITVNQFTAPHTFFRKVLCPVSFTPAGRAALRHAAEISADAPLVLFRGCEANGLQNNVHDLIDLEEWAPEDLAGRCEVKTLPNRLTPQQLVDLASLEGVDLIALAIPSGRESIAERIVEESECAVLTVNEQTANREVSYVSRSSRPHHQIA